MEFLLSKLQSYSSFKKKKKGYKVINSFGMVCQDMSWFVSLSPNMQQLMSPKVLQFKVDAAMIFSILIVTLDVSERAPVSTEQSDLKIASCNPMSIAKETASSIALASAPSGPNGSGSHLLKAARTAPSWSCTMTPIPTDLVFLKTTASVLTLYHRKVGGIHLSL